ncbi:MAG: VPLPA-CTERM sorting domain-containing protein [Proteobacteria bacterium]|nr:VPLPA-CTERM sorting domain-containing protein [Pseudomonadota bacterium]
MRVFRFTKSCNLRAIKKLTTAAIAAFLFVTPVQAASTFSIIGVNPTALAHPTGIGHRAASASWGISATGGGFLDGTLILNDAFALPTNPGDSAAFDVGDIASLSYRHGEAALPSSTLPIAGGFLFNALPGQISSASGTVLNNGGGLFTLINPVIQTSIDATLFQLPRGLLSGEYILSGITAGLNVEQINNVPVPSELALLIVSGQYDGQWRITSQDISAVPVPAALPLFLSGLLGLGIMARRRKQNTAA